jgi:hypothetical protein
MVDMDRGSFAQMIGGAPEVIGYERNGDRQKGFNHGWNSAASTIFHLEQMAVGESIIAELGLKFTDMEEA